MSASAVKYCLWFGLLVLLPWPYYEQGWSLNTALYSAKYFIHSLSWLLLAQVCIAIVLLYQLTQFYLRTSINWPVKFRGAIMGIFLLSALIIFSTWPIYSGLPLVASKSYTFLELYR